VGVVKKEGGMKMTKIGPINVSLGHGLPLPKKDMRYERLDVS